MNDFICDYYTALDCDIKPHSLEQTTVELHEAESPPENLELHL